MKRNRRRICGNCRNFIIDGCRINDNEIRFKTAKACKEFKPVWVKDVSRLIPKERIKAACEEAKKV